MFDSKKLAASCTAVASLAMFGLAGTAMAVETPTTGDTAAASITLNAAEGNTLAGHTFTFYRLGSYGDITAGTTGTDVKSLTVNKIDDASDKWIAAANAKAGIADLQGFDAAGVLAHVGKDGEPTGSVQGKLREAAKQLAATAGTDGETLPVTTTATGTGTTMTVADLPNGLYLIVDSAGSPMIVGTPIQGSKTLNGVTLGALTVKSKTVAIDKKVSHDRKDKTTLIDSKAGNGESSASWNVGDTVDFQYEFTIGNKQNTVKMVVADTMSGLTLSGDPVFKVGQTAVNPTVVKTNGFTATFDQNLVKQYENRKVTVSYKATVTNASRAKQASNTVALASTQYDGTAQAAATVDANDTATVSAYDLNVKKTNWDGKAMLAGAGFKIHDENTNKWMKQTDGSWTYVDQQKDATQFLTGDNGQVNIAGLGAGDYRMVEQRFRVPRLESEGRRHGCRIRGRRNAVRPIDRRNDRFVRRLERPADPTARHRRHPPSQPGRTPARRRGTGGMGERTTAAHAMRRGPHRTNMAWSDAGLRMHAGGISGGELMFPPPPPSLPRRPGKLSKDVRHG